MWLKFIMSCMSCNTSLWHCACHMTNLWRGVCHVTTRSNVSPYGPSLSSDCHQYIYLMHQLLKQGWNSWIAQYLWEDLHQISQHSIFRCPKTLKILVIEDELLTGWKKYGEMLQTRYQNSLVPCHHGNHATTGLFRNNARQAIHSKTWYKDHLHVSHKSWYWGGFIIKLKYGGNNYWKWAS